MGALTVPFLIMATHKPVEIEELYGSLNIVEPKNRWYVIHSKPRCEKKLAEFAQKYKICYYLPLRESTRHYKYRKIIFTKPLFPSYVFIKCNFDQKEFLYRSGCIVKILEVIDQKEFIEDLKQIYKGKEKGAELKPSQYLANGQKVKIVKGPFIGLTGVVKKHRIVKEVILQVNMLRQGVSVQVEPDQVKIL
ncbi:MAG: transcription termination/antitermination NusG family protein [Candidatus Cloacimonadota bacterium]|nr:transcription termination/antitermination NusG family protein [Candidatus Cloacimonadota bacterium]